MKLKEIYFLIKSQFSCSVSVKNLLIIAYNVCVHVLRNSVNLLLIHLVLFLFLKVGIGKYVTIHSISRYVYSTCTVSAICWICFHKCIKINYEKWQTMAVHHVLLCASTLYLVYQASTRNPSQTVMGQSVTCRAF